MQHRLELDSFIKIKKIILKKKEVLNLEGFQNSKIDQNIVNFAEKRNFLQHKFIGFFFSHLQNFKDNTNNLLNKNLIEKEYWQCFSDCAIC